MGATELSRLARCFPFLTFWPNLCPASWGNTKNYYEWPGLSVREDDEQMSLYCRCYISELSVEHKTTGMRKQSRGQKWESHEMKVKFNPVFIFVSVIFEAVGTARQKECRFGPRWRSCLLWCKQSVKGQNQVANRCLGAPESFVSGSILAALSPGNLWLIISLVAPAALDNEQLTVFPRRTTLRLHLPHRCKQPLLLCAAPGNTRKKCAVTVFTCVPSVTLCGELVLLGLGVEGTYLSSLRGDTSPLHACTADFPHTLLRSTCSMALMPPGFVLQTKCAQKQIL